jgi:uncharacterized protein (DUF1778 family)
MKNQIKKPAKETACHLLPLRVTEKEYKLIKRATKESGDRYMTRYMRRIVMEAVKK